MLVQLAKQLRYNSFFQIKITNIQIDPKRKTITMQNTKFPFQHQNKQSCPVTMHNSSEVSFEQPARKYSMSSLNGQIDIDKLMVDIKLTPLKSNQFHQKIKTIYSCLDYFKRISPGLLQEVRTAELIIENIQSKFLKQYMETQRNSQKINSQSKINSHISASKASAKKRQEEQVLLSKRNSNKKVFNVCSEISPIKQLQEMTSRIVYTNFSLKELQGSCRNLQSNRRASLERQSSNKRSSSKELNLGQSKSVKQIRSQPGSKPKVFKKQVGIFTVSKFDSEDEQMQRLTKNIQALDKVLEQKGLGLKNQLFRDKYSKFPLKQALKQNNQNSQKRSIFKSDRKPIMMGIHNSKTKCTANKENFY